MALTPLKAFPNYGTSPVAPPVPFPTALPNGQTYVSDLIGAQFGGAVLFAATSDQVVTLQIQRYADRAGNVPLDLILTPLTANTPGWVFCNDGLPYISFTVSIVNASGSTANITNPALLAGVLK